MSLSLKNKKRLKDWLGNKRITIGLYSDGDIGIALEHTTLGFSSIIIHRSEAQNLRKWLDKNFPAKREK